MTSSRPASVFMWVMAVVGMVALAGCSDTDGAQSPDVFGEVDGGCGVTVLTNGTGDEWLLREGVDCLIERVDDREAVVWDLLTPTVEGDPILWRFEGDGEQVTITVDHTRDAFGSGTVVVQVCDTIDDTGFVPVGVDCVGATGLPFELPDGMWLP